MPDRHIHLIAFDIPVPANYGGAIDIFYKLKAFKDAGIRTTLHCFEYDRKPASELFSFCDNVYYYKRDISKTKLFHRLPYIVATRNAPDLIKLLLRDNDPILFEGLHTTYFLNDKRIRERRKIVRTHNIEHNYYKGLGNVERDLFKRYYFFNEAAKLAKYEKILDYADGIAAISKSDETYFAAKFKNVINVSAFHPSEKVDIKKGKGNMALYHGSLEIGENNEAAIFLVKNIFSQCKHKLIIAGNKPSKELKNLVKSQPNVEIISNISSEEIYELISNAHINILPTFQNTGIKLKLIAALYRGRHCLVNSPMVENTGLEPLCHVADDAESMVRMIEKLFQTPFTESEIQQRKEFLDQSKFSNQKNIELLIHQLFN